MAINFSSASLARTSARHPWRVIAVWIVLVAILGGLSSRWLADSLSSDIRIITEVESIEGLRRLKQAGLDDVAPFAETIVIWSLDGRTVDDPAFGERVVAVTERVRELQREWSAEDGEPVGAGSFGLGGIGEYPRVLSWYELARLGVPQADSLVAADRQSTVVIVGLPNDGESGARMHRFYKEIDAFAGDGIQVATIGQLTFQERFSEIAEDDLVKGESIGIPMALVVLVAVFGALVAPVLPLLLGMSSILVALGLVAILGQFGSQQLFIQNMVTMFGLALGIDYALFVVARFREERRAGYTVPQAIERAGATSSRAVIFSGATVVLSLAGVMLVPTNIFRSLGLGAILVVTVSVLASLTLLPAMLRLLGDRISWPARPDSERPMVPHSTLDPFEGFWGRLTHVVMARPIVSAVLSAAVLLAAAIPAVDLHTGVESLASLPPGPARDAYEVLTTNYPAGLIAPVQLLVGGEPDAAASALERLRQGVANSGLFAPELGAVSWSEDGRTGTFSATLLVETDSDAAYEVIRTLRDEIVPAAVGDTPGVDAWVTGTTATNLDFVNVIDRYTPWVFIFVLTLSFLLLMLAFRSIVVPLKAIVLNLLSVGATWGLMVLVFQKGVLADTLGFQQTPVIQSWIPILLFAVLFGLSMDYHVFLLSRIREHFDLTGRNRESVAVGLHATARIITGAALIMVVVFGGFASGSLVALQQLGFGLAVAVFLDATIVRSVLVPASMALLGSMNWYLPSWLEWLPDLRVEGHVDTPAGHDTAPVRGPGVTSTGRS